MEELNDFLYDFEDYVEADRFDGSRFSELYALSRKAAPRILHIITRMKLASPQFQDSTTSPVIETISQYAESPLPYPDGPEADGQIQDALRHVAKLDRTVEGTPAEAFAVLPYPEEEYAPPPPVPVQWPRTFHTSMGGPYRTAQRPGTTASFPGSAPGSDVYPGRNLSPSSGQNSISFPPVPPRSPARRSNTHYSNDRLGPQSEVAAASARYRGTESTPAAPSSLSTRASIGSSTIVSSQSSVSDHHRERQSSYIDIVSPVSTVDRDSVSSERHGQLLQVPPLFARSTSEFPGLPVGGSLSVLANARQDVPDGLIPVDDETTECAPPLRPPPPIPEDCSITLNSSFYHFKGFCQGSMEIIQGGIGVRRIKKQVSSVLTRDPSHPRAHSVPGPFRGVQRDRQVQVVSVRTRMGGC